MHFPLYLTTLMLSTLLRFHSVHISYANATIYADSVHIKVSYYKDDFTKAVDNWFEGKTKSFTPDQMKDAEAKYFKEYCRMWSGQNFTHPLLQSSCSRTDDATSLIFEAGYRSDIPIKQLTIDHRVICKEYNDQMNIMTITGIGDTRNIIFSQSKPTAVISSN